jgi:hypothetical protein
MLQFVLAVIAGNPTTASLEILPSDSAIFHENEISPILRGHAVYAFDPSVLLKDTG